MVLRLTSEQLQLLRDESRKIHPIEACGLLFGRMIDGEAVVTRVVMMPNVLKSSTRFEADSQTVFNAFEQADEAELQFIGLFHSHPAPASPSEVDLKYMRLWGKAVWLILSSGDGNIAAFQLTNGDLLEVGLRIETM